MTNTMGVSTIGDSGSYENSLLSFIESDFSVSEEKNPDISKISQVGITVESLLLPGLGRILEEKNPDSIKLSPETRENIDDTRGEVSGILDVENKTDEVGKVPSLFGSEQTEDKSRKIEDKPTGNFVKPDGKEIEIYEDNDSQPWSS